MVPWTHLREPPLWGKCLTDLTSEFTHFNLVIRLSKVQQLAFRLCTIFRSPAAPAVLCEPLWKASLLSEAVPNVRNLHLLQHLLQTQTSCQSTVNRQAHDLQVWSFFFWWLSGEVKHVVHLIRWNSYSRYMPLWLTWKRACCGTIARPLGYRNWVLFVNYLFWFLFVTN